MLSIDVKKQRSGRRRKGAILLVALVLLTLLLMLGLYYYQVAASFSRTSKARLKGAHQGYDSKELLNGALSQVIRGTTNPASAAYRNSLLEDLYGREHHNIKVVAVSDLANGQFQSIQFAGTPLRNHQCDGCVASFRNSSGSVVSGRVVKYLGREQTLVTEGLAAIQVGDRLLINGYPCNAIVDSQSSNPPSDADEAWDAVDQHNLFLGQLGDSEKLTIPSFHRPSGVTLRPDTSRHPNFAPAEALFEFGQGNWDVDNNGDGLNDSVWVDFGLAPIQLEPGLRCKPLVAALIVDLDGRLNLNAHGNWGQLSQPEIEPIRGIEPAGGKSLPMDLMRGVGVGPAEIGLRGILKNDFERLLQYRSQSPKEHIATHGNVMPGNVTPGTGNSRGTDVSGQSFVYLDEEGQPVHVQAAPVVASPYGRAQLRPSASARPFDAGDLEWLLRNNEYDEAQQSTRLRETINSSDSKTFTSRSVSIPLLPKIGSQGLVETVADRLRRRGVAEELVEQQLNLILPAEILRGEKMDLNRPFQIRLGIDEKNEDQKEGRVVAPGGIPGDLVPHGVILSREDQLQYAKGLYAKHLYCLMMAVLPEDAVAETTEELSTHDKQRLLAIQVAQWAVNVVDFRDEDGVSTPFEFDIDPWDGWHVNGILKSDRLNQSGTKREDRNTRFVVWGMERPELIMTESLALHDRMVGDFDIGGRRKAKPGLEPDDDLDQIRQPEGVLLVELKSPHSSQATPDTDPSWPKPVDRSQKGQGLYFQHGASNLPILNLDKSQIGAGGFDYSVWRIAISEWHGPKNEVSSYRSPLAMSQRATDSASFEVDAPVSLVDRSGPSLKAERMIWLTSTKPTEEHPDFGRLYYTETIPGFWNNRAQLSVGETAVISPHFNFSIGQGERATPAWIFHRTKQKFVFAGFGDPHIEFEDELGNIRRRKALPILATSGPVPDEAGTLQPAVGVSVSEPIPKQHAQVYGDTRAILRDRPSDDHPLAPLAAAPLLRETHTDPDFKTLFLQRLADPRLGWNPPLGHALHVAGLPVNPYLSVDWMPVQLSVFNSAWLPSEMGDWDAAMDGDFDPADPAFDDAGFRYQDRLQFSSLEWTGRLHRVDPVSRQLLHAFTPPQLSDFWGASARQNRHRLTNESQRPPLRLAHTIGYAENFQELLDRTGKRVRFPRPWICWNNRDFANHYELLNVPRSSSSRFRHEFRLPDTAEDPQFGHLLNFFSDELPYHRLLDYVHVPSRFVDSQVRITPDSSNKSQSALSSMGLDYPFNHRSRFQDPGKVNVNTIQHPEVARALGLADPNTQERDSQEQVSMDLEDLARRLTSDRTTGFHNNPLRNSYYQHLPLQKLANVVANKSNVYAVWLTVGFFELEPNYPTAGDGNSADLSRPYFVDAAHPDGYRLGAEFETGNVRRHRIFAIVDRSIPVAFEPGQNHNSAKTILLRRILD